MRNGGSYKPKMMTLTIQDEDGVPRTIDSIDAKVATVADLLAASPSKRGRVLLNGEALPADSSLESCGISEDSSPSLRVARRRRRLEPVDTNRLQQWSMLSPAARAHVRDLPAPMPEPELPIEAAPENAGGLPLAGGRARAFEILALLESDPHNFDLTRQPLNVFREVLVAMFEKQDLLEPFGVSRPQFEAFVEDLCDEYAFNPFHSFTHAVDVTAGAYIGLRQLGGGALLRPLSQWALLLAAAGHDVGHPGTTNAYQKEADTALYREHGGDATLERMHTKLALSLIDKHRLLSGLSAQDATAVRELVEFAVLGTDISANQSIMDSFVAATELVAAHGGSWSAGSCLSVPPPLEAQLLRMLLKCSDLGCCTKCFTIGQHWADCLARECERQADLPDGNDGGMNLDTIAKCQTGFFKFICVPMFDAMAVALPDWVCVAEKVRENGQLWSQLAESRAEEQ